MRLRFLLSNMGTNLLSLARLSSATNRLITAKDHASVQLNVGEVDASGRYTGSFTTYALCGFVRKESEADDSINRLATQDGRKCK